MFGLLGADAVVALYLEVRVGCALLVEGRCGFVVKILGAGPALSV